MTEHLLGEDFFRALRIAVLGIMIAGLCAATADAREPRDLLADIFAHAPLP